MYCKIEIKNKKLKQSQMKQKTIIAVLTATLSLFSCTNEDLLVDNQDCAESKQLDVLQKQDLKFEFAKALSSVICNSVDARRIIKTEAIKQFDKNYDVLWATIKDERIGNSTFAECVASYSSSDLIDAINENLPLLNILFPEIKMFDINAETYDCSDNELPVSVCSEGKNLLIYAGEVTDTIPTNEVPAFNVLVVNENNRVIANKEVMTRGANYNYSFVSPSFDGSQINSSTRSTVVDNNYVGNKAISAYQYFYKDDASTNSMALQRDYIYYGLTPTNQSGALNYNVNEYISFIEVNPTTYFNIADQTETGSISDDPYIKANSVSRKKRDFTESELIDALWTKGAYNFRFEILRSTNESPQILYIPVKPSDIWNFNLDRTYRHSTAFRHSKYTYKIDPNKFTSKRFYLSPGDISLGKWNLAEESVYRYVTIIEEDESIEKTTTYQYEVVNVLSTKFKGDVKLELGLGKNDKVGADVGIEVTTSNTKKETHTATITRKEQSDNLGSVKIYFYDPIIESKISATQYQMRTYNTGHVKFGISAY